MGVPISDKQALELGTTNICNQDVFVLLEGKIPVLGGLAHSSQFCPLLHLNLLDVDFQASWMGY